MALQTFYTPLTTAGTRTRSLPGTARNRLLMLGGSTAASGRVAVAAAVPPAAWARTRCSGAADEAAPTPEPSTLLKTLFKTLAAGSIFLINIIIRICMGLFPTTVHRIIYESLISADDNDTRKYIDIAVNFNYYTELAKRHNKQSKKAENPCADASIKEAAASSKEEVIRKIINKTTLEVSLALYRASPTTTEPLTVETFDTLADELWYWVNNPPKSMKDFKKIEISSGKCMDLIPRMVDDLSLVFPFDILQEIVDIESKFVKLYKLSAGEVPRPDAEAIYGAMIGVERMKKIFMDGVPGLRSYTRP